ncbi:Hypothetical predicted protein [Podarcis lilfordi]|uniref:Uncharacterized protein n=1 Tax=Podarcis lilfordi TaxID=74358 RepID=A0AA35NW50_9SAUR|nr:Hypothetical predicted protein [Podarcis lilfordi]
MTESILETGVQVPSRLAKSQYRLFFSFSKSMEVEGTALVERIPLQHCKLMGGTAILSRQHKQWRRFSRALRWRCEFFLASTYRRGGRGSSAESRV